MQITQYNIAEIGALDRYEILSAQLPHEVVVEINGYFGDSAFYIVTLEVDGEPDVECERCFSTADEATSYACEMIQNNVLGEFGE